MPSPLGLRNTWTWLGKYPDSESWADRSMFKNARYDRYQDESYEDTEGLR
jgi:hypothetical protein